MTMSLDHPDVRLVVQKSAKLYELTAIAKNGSYLPRARCTTAYPIDLIQKILATKGTFVCDEIARDEDPLYVEHDLRWDLFSYEPAESFAGKRLLDFGCGSGASSAVLSRLLPTTQIVGVELSSEYLTIAKRRAEHYGLTNVAFVRSPDATNLPHNVGEFDYILLCAVYEHLLPAERKLLLSLLWQHLSRDGTLFINQTPHRWFPVETHTTGGLPCINYLPDKFAHRFAKLSKKTAPHQSWNDLLRAGIRGATETEILRLLPDDASLTPPLIARDRIELWCQMSGSVRYSSAKRIAACVFRALQSITGITLTPSISLAIRKN